MRVDRTWTISFEDHELNRLLSEIEEIKLPPDLGWKPILVQLACSRQITLPLRAIERLSLELDIARIGYHEHRQEYQKKYPMITALSSEVESILHCSKRKSA